MRSIKLINQEIERLKKLEKTKVDKQNISFISGKINALIWVKDDNL